MLERHVAVLGGGVTGLAVSLLLARDGHRVTLVERDPVLPTPPGDAFDWPRAGIPHFLQPHAFIPRGRKELVERVPDVHAALLATGAHDVDLRRKLPGPEEPADADLQYLAVRRPLVEWALREAVRREVRIALAQRMSACGVRLDKGRVVAVETAGGALDADAVVDAMGRRSPMREWLGACGVSVPPPEQSDCGVVYYSRYYRLRPGRSLPDGRWLLSPRGDLGYMGFATFPGDDDTFAAVLAVPPGVPGYKALRHDAAFEGTVAQIPLLATWADPDLCEPITGILPMAGLRNTFDGLHTARPAGLFVAGDALGHTDPVLAHGLAFGLIHAAALSAALSANDDLGDASAAYASAVVPALRERYRLATALDEQRLRMWTGRPADFTHRGGDYELFTLVAGGAVAPTDASVFRAYVRRFGLLESTQVLDGDDALLTRIETGFQAIAATPRPPQGPPREALLERLRAAG